MLPGGRDNRSHPYTGHRPLSDKEEIARAALRSLAAPTSGSSAASNEPLPLLPPPSLVSATQLPPPHLAAAAQPTASYSARRHDDRSAYLDDAMSVRSSSFTAHEQTRGSSSIGDAAMSRTGSSSSFFQDQHITTSPDSSPRLDAAPLLPPPPTHRYARHSVPSASSTSSHVHEVALRRASLALGVNVEQVRQIVHHAYVSRRASNDSSSASASSQAYFQPSSSGPDHESGFVRQVLDAYCLESNRASQPQPAFDTARRADNSRASFTGPPAEDRAAAAPSGMTWNEASHPPERPSQSQYYHTDRGTPVAWGSRSDERLPTFDSHHPDSSFRSARPAYHDPPRRHEPSASTSAMGSVSEQQRAESPSPFAYDAYRRPTQSVSHEFGLASASNLASRASHGYLDEMTRSRAIDEERNSGHWSRQPFSSYAHQPHPSQSAMHERRVRSIDDYLEQQQQQQQQQQQHRQRRGSIAHHPGRTSGIVEYEDDRLPDRHSRSNIRHSFQPYPTPSSRYASGPSAAGSANPLVQSPQLSPTMPEAPRFQPFSQRRSPLLRSPAAETVTSVASSSVTSVAALSPSPLLGAAGSSASLTPDELRRSAGADADPQRSLRGVSEDTAAETTRAGVAKLQIDDIGTSSKGPKASAARKIRSTRSSFSHADRGSVPIVGTDLSHSEIMQKLQDKVKSRLAAKGKAAMLSERSSPRNGGSSDSTGKIAKNGNGSGTGNSNKAAKLSRAGSTKRSAASIGGKSDKSGRASAASPHSSRRSSESSTTATAEKSAAPVNGAPAPKVRRTSASSQQKPAPKPSPQPASKPSSPSSQKSNTTPTSIEAALLSPTDTPTPSEAAANHAQRLSRSPIPPEGAVETASGQSLPSELPGAGQMNASSATKQQTSMAGIDSLLQAAQTNDPTETNSAIA